MKKITPQIERRTLLVTFILTAISGIGLHLCGHGNNHHQWHIWSVAHVVSALAWLAIVVFHVKRRYKWYVQIVKKGMRNKSWVTLLLTILYAAVSITGIILLVAINGANSRLGLWHYKMGLILLIPAAIHALKLRRFIQKRRPTNTQKPRKS